MALSPSPHLLTLLGELGREWPSSDEEVLAANARAFCSAAVPARDAILTIERALAHVDTTNSPEVTEAFLGYMRSEESNLSSLRDFAEAMEITARELDVIAHTVLHLKLTIIEHLEELREIIPSGATTLDDVATSARDETRRQIHDAIELAKANIRGDGEEDGRHQDDHSRSTADDGDHVDLRDLANRGDALQESGDPAGAVQLWRCAVDLLPEPKLEHPLAMWLHASIGDALFEMGLYGEAEPELAKALVAGGNDNPFVWLRQGQVRVELGQQAAGVEALTSAYMLEGEEIFEDEDPKYRRLLVQHKIIQD